MDTFEGQIDGLRDKMLERHKAKLRKLAGLDQQVLADDEALREELRGIRRRHELRCSDIRAELESFAADLGMLPPPRDVTPAPAELPDVDQALAQIERRPPIAPVPQVHAAAPAVHAVPPRFDAVHYPQYGAAPNVEPLPRIVRSMAGG